MSTGCILLKNCLFYSLETRNICTSVSQIENFIPSNSSVTINKKVVDKLFEVVTSLKDNSSSKDLYSVEAIFKEGCDIQSKLVTKSIEAIKYLYSSTNEEEVAKEISQILSIFYENVKILKNSVVTLVDIERVLCESVSEILMECLKKTQTIFESDFLLINSDSLSNIEKQYKIFDKSICDAFGRAFILALELSDNKTIVELVNSFIIKNGTITVEVCKSLILNSVLLFYKESKGQFYIKDKLKNIFSRVVDNDANLSDYIIIRTVEITDKKNFCMEDFVNWAMLEIQHPQQLVIPYIVYTNRMYLFDIKFVRDKNLFDVCCRYFNDIVQTLVKHNPFVIKVLLNSLREKLIQKKYKYKDVVLIEIISMILTAISYNNAILNGFVKKEVFYEMTRLEILKELSKDLSKIRTGEAFSKCNKEQCRLLSSALFDIKKSSSALSTCSETGGGISHKEKISKLELRIIFDVFFDDLDIHSELVNILEEISNCIVAKNMMTIRTPKIIPSDKDLSLMLMFAVSEKAEEFIEHNYSNIEKELLEKQAGSSRLLKIDQVLKSFLTTTFLSKLAKSIYISRTSKDIPEEGVQLKLVEAFKDAFVFYDIIPISKEDILEKLQDNVFQPKICEELTSITLQECDNFAKNLRARFISYSKDNGCRETDLLLCNTMQEACICNNSIDILVSNFFSYVSSEKLREVPILRCKVYGLIQAQLFCILKEDFIKDFRSLSKQYLLLRTGEFKAFSRLVKQKGIPSDAADKITLLMCSVMLMVWAKGQGLRKLEEKQQLSSRDVLLEVFSSDEYLQEGLRDFFCLSFSLSNRRLYYIAEKLNCSRDGDKTELVSIFSHFAVVLKKQPDGEELFKAIFKGLGNSLKKIQAKELHGYQRNLKLSKVEQSRLDRLKRKKEQQDEKDKQKLELQERDIKAKEMSSENVFHKDELKEDLMPDDDVLKQNDGFEEEVYDSESKSSSSFEGIDDSQIQDPPDTYGILQKQTVDEIVFEGQFKALEELELTLGGLTREQRDLLLTFAASMRTNVIDKVYIKGAIDNEKQRKEQRFIASWGTKYKFQDIEAEEGAAAPINIEYTIIQSKAFVKWLEKRNPRIQEEIKKRFTKVVIEGDLGDIRALNSGDLGAYEFKFRDSCLTRIYYVPKGKNIYILCGGDKSDQGRTIVERLPILVAELKKAIEI